MTKDIKSAPARTKIYIRLLTSKHGTDVATMEQAVRDAEADGTIPPRRKEGYTRHNSYSLAKLALTYGFTFRTDTNAKGVKEYEGATRYFFDSVKNNPKLAAKADKAKEAKVSSKARLPRVEGVKAPVQPEAVTIADIAAKASTRARKARNEGAQG